MTGNGMSEDRIWEEARRGYNQGFEQARASLRRPTILTCGYTGSGKTTLAQGICGRDVVPDEMIGHCEPTTQSYVLYESELIRFWDSQGFEPGMTEAEFVEKSRRFVRSLQDKSDVDEHIHLVWYCIHGALSRVTRYDIDLIRDVFPNVVVVLTQADKSDRRAIEGMTAKLIREGVHEDRIVTVSKNDEESLRRLVGLSHELLPEAYRDAFLSAQLVDLDRKNGKAYAIISAHCLLAAGIGAVPIPFADAPILVANQAAMIGELAVLYGMATEALKMQMLPMLAKAAGVFTASTLSKFFPILGSVINAVVASSLTFAVGEMTRSYLRKCCEARLRNEPPPAFVFDERQFTDTLRRAKKEKPW